LISTRLAIYSRIHKKEIP